MARIASLLGLLLLVGLGAWYYGRSEEKPTALEVKYRYLVVSIEAPEDWVKRHHFTIRWRGKTVELPVAFRIPGPADKFKLGAGPEIMQYLAIGDEEVPVTGKPDTKFRVGNELGFAFVPEQSSREGVVAVSFATWVAVSPVEQSSLVGPDGNKAEMAEAGNTLAKRLQELIAAGRVIDLQSSR